MSRARRSRRRSRPSHNSEHYRKAGRHTAGAVRHRGRCLRAGRRAQLLGSSVCVPDGLTGRAGGRCSRRAGTPRRMSSSLVPWRLLGWVRRGTAVVSGRSWRAVTSPSGRSCTSGRKASGGRGAGGLLGVPSLRGFPVGAPQRGFSAHTLRDYGARHRRFERYPCSCAVVWGIHAERAVGNECGGELVPRDESS